MKNGSKMAVVACLEMPQPMSFSDKMLAGASMADGMAGSMPIREPRFPKYEGEFMQRQDVHKPTRSN